MKVKFSKSEIRQARKIKKFLASKVDKLGMKMVFLLQEIRAAEKAGQDLMKETKETIKEFRKLIKMFDEIEIQK